MSNAKQQTISGSDCFQHLIPAADTSTGLAKYGIPLAIAFPLHTDATSKKHVDIIELGAREAASGASPKLMDFGHEGHGLKHKSDAKINWSIKEKTLSLCENDNKPYEVFEKPPKPNGSNKCSISLPPQVFRGGNAAAQEVKDEFEDSYEVILDYSEIIELDF